MRLSRKAPVLLLLLAAALLTIVVLAPLAPAKTLPPNKVGAKAYSYIEKLTRVDNGDGTYTGRWPGCSAPPVRSPRQRKSPAGSATRATWP